MAGYEALSRQSKLYPYAKHEVFKFMCYGQVGKGAYHTPTNSTSTSIEKAFLNALL
jgi:hypothetical protein